MVAHHVLPAARLIVHILNVQPNHIGEQALRQAVLTHHLDRFLTASIGERQVTVRLNTEQPVLLHTGNSLRNSRPGVLQTFGDARTHGGNALFLKLKDGAQVHFGSVNKIGHAACIPFPCRLGKPSLSYDALLSNYYVPF